MTWLSRIAVAVGSTWGSLAIALSVPPVADEQSEGADPPDADSHERDVRILMSHWF